MKKRFTLKVMYGDADEYDTFSYITEDEDESKFITYFLENYNRDLFYFYDRPDLLKYNKTFKGNEEKLIHIINQMILLANPICEKEELGKFDIISDDAFKEEIHRTLSEIIAFVGDMFDFCMYHAGMDYNGCPQNYKIEDITGCVEMTKNQVIKMVKEKIGIDIIFID